MTVTEPAVVVESALARLATELRAAADIIDQLAAAGVVLGGYHEPFASVYLRSGNVDVLTTILHTVRPDNADGSPDACGVRTWQWERDLGHVTVKVTAEGPHAVERGERLIEAVQPVAALVAAATAVVEVPA